MKRKIYATIVRQQKGWAIKLKEDKKNPIIIARSRKYYLTNWIRHLFNELDGFHYDVSMGETKKFVGHYMNRRFGKKAKPRYIK